MPSNRSTLSSTMKKWCKYASIQLSTTIRSAILARENPLLVEENHARQTTNAPNVQMLYSQSDDGRGFN